MVAIVGGLLVARFVSIASEQEGAQRLLNNVQGRCTIARRRGQRARDNLHSWYINDFFEMKVIQAIGEGERSVPALRKIGGYTPLTDDELSETIQAIADEFEIARSTLDQLMSADASDDYPEWEDFKHSHPSLPKTKWDEVWETTYENIVRPPQPAHPAMFGGLGSLIGTVPFVAMPTPPEYVALNIQRRDVLRTNLERAKQHLEDVEEELARLERARDAIVRPKFGWGLVVLGFFTLVGVIIPIWLMSRAPEHLTPHFGEVVFWLFFAGLLTLLGYMSVLALRLAGWQRSSTLST